MLEYIVSVHYYRKMFRQQNYICLSIHFMVYTTIIFFLLNFHAILFMFSLFFEFVCFVTVFPFSFVGFGLFRHSFPLKFACLFVLSNLFSLMSFYTWNFYKIHKHICITQHSTVCARCVHFLVWFKKYTFASWESVKYMIIDQKREETPVILIFISLICVINTRQFLIYSKISSCGEQWTHMVSLVKKKTTDCFFSSHLKFSCFDLNLGMPEVKV